MHPRRLSFVGLCLGFFVLQLQADVDLYLVDVPDYDWYGGSLGTASGNLIGFWDRHGLPNLYTGPAGNGLAPLSSFGGNSGIHALWASRAGADGRPANTPGHIDDYWTLYDLANGGNSYESTAPDPYLVLRRPEHPPDCIGDFIGLSQRKWTNMNNECDGNIDGLAFNYWDNSGNRRTNFIPGTEAGTGTSGSPARDMQSGLRQWTRSRGYDADVFSQITDFNPNVSSGRGFTFNDLKAEIDSGYPVLLFLQSFTQFSRPMPPTGTVVMPHANPQVHGMLAYGYSIADDGTQMVHYRSSFADDSLGQNQIVAAWNADAWNLGLPVRGVIGFHPKPKMTEVTPSNGAVTLKWDGPASQVYDRITGFTTMPHRYVLERSLSLSQPFIAITQPATNRSLTIIECCAKSVFYRVRLVTP